MALFPEDRVVADMDDVSAARLKRGALLVHRSRQWGGRAGWCYRCGKDLQLAQFRPPNPRGRATSACVSVPLQEAQTEREEQEYAGGEKRYARR